ncbi:THUMP domain-containing class I SAM-dependent RNA methyltransferase [Aquabacterium sp.]|uniref:THUMP domain-containing class I SAM-dependent RNA methyltransferase n=1 Tax=Aquabacterium sp. TaxID=1872578 RepID=UPI002C58D03B|nr:THUMP domain-containing protein [Aquabacterium sp.]HSW05295.1 THUMP domain-containing protein [Aquabacterium sp.]
MAALFLPCAAGVEPLLVDECKRLLGDKAQVMAARGGVVVHGDALTAMRLNLHSRLAQRVLWPLAHAPYRSEHDLYDLARTVRWGDWITPQQTFRIDTTAQRSPLQSLNFATLRVKDGLCDVLRDATGERPSVDTRFPDLPLTLHLSATDATLYADTSGEALFKRGWREAKGEAPLKETLAAAMLAAAGWRGRAEDGALFDPCCGAGTIAIEAAQIACGIAPGLQRRFAFEKMLPFRTHQNALRQMKDEARALKHAPAVPLFAGDVAFRMTDFATRNAERAGVSQAIEFKTADALQRLPPAETGVMMLNPPYGERIEPKGSRGGERIEPKGSPAAKERGSREGFEGGGSPAEFFSQLASHWKRHYAGWSAYVLSPDMKLPQALRLKENQRTPMWNGPIECRLFRFDLVAGSARTPKPDTEADPATESPRA